MIAEIIQILLIASNLLVLFFVLGLRAYVKKKAENLADKEDLEALTRIVESVRIQFDKSKTVHAVQFKAEFEYFQDVWLAARNVAECSVRINPVATGLTGAPTQTDFDNFIDTQLAYAVKVDACKPFIPPDVWKALDEFDSVLINIKIEGLTGISIEAVRARREGVRQALERCAQAIQKRLSELLVV